MSGLYIRVYSSFFTHRKTAKLRTKVGDDAFWIPPRLWAYAAENQPDGDFSAYSSEEIAMLTGCYKHAPSIRQALVEAGFLDSDGKIHDWNQHNGYHKSFSERARKAAKARWSVNDTIDKDRDRDKDIDIETSIAPSMPQACSKHKRFVPPSLGECIEYGKEIGLSEDDAIHFYDHYEANGWRTKAGKMRDWKASMRTWKRTGESFRRNTQPQLPTRYGTSTPSDAPF